MYVTVLPKPNTHYECVAPMNSINFRDVMYRVGEMLWTFGTKAMSTNEYCGDYIYSGHTMIMLITYCTVKECKFNYVIYLLVTIASNH